MEYFIQSSTHIETSILFMVIITFLIQSFFYLFVFIRVIRYKFKKIPGWDSQEPVSIVICARNEADNLTKFLPYILEQEYPDYEVIVVNDCSEDNSQQILEDFQEKYPHLKITQIKHDEKFTHGKKLALTIGIKAAKNDWILLTDADCKPQDRLWISTFQRNFAAGTDIVLGYGGYSQSKGFLNKLIRFDTFFIGLQYLGFALIHLPYMGVGRNLAYRKSLYLKNKGFASHAHIVSGDDDLFINEVATSHNTRVEFSVPSHTRSVPKETIRQWKNQKKRHLSTWTFYKFKHKLLLSLEIFSRFLFYAGIILLLVNPKIYLFGIAFLTGRWIIQLLVFHAAMKKLNEKKILLFSILFDIILPLINLFLYSVSMMNSKKRQWK